MAAFKKPFGTPLYRETTVEGFVSTAKEMMAFAREQPPFDCEKFSQEAMATPGVNCQQVGPMLSARGGVQAEGLLSQMKPYTRFVNISGSMLQVTYFEFELENVGRTGQLTLVDSCGFPLDVDVAVGLASFFFDLDKDRLGTVDTPSHVFVLIKGGERAQN